MKKFYLVLLIGQLVTSHLHSQNIAVNGTGSLPDTSAMLDVSSTNKGFLLPRMTTTQQNAIPLPANGLLVFNTTDNAFRYNSGIPAIPSWSIVYSPTILVAASVTTTYVPALAYAIVKYNTASINVATAYNVSTGIFTAPATGVYQIIVSNMYTNGSNGNNSISARVIVNGVTDVETALTLSPSSGTIYGTIYCNTVVRMTAGQTANVSVGNEVNTMNPTIGTAQHTLKIIRLN